MTGAIFGLIGVVVGGVLTVVIELLREWRSVRTETRAGARLLSAELSVQQVILEARADDPARPADDETPAISAWPEYRAVMARVLDQGAWAAVAGAYANLALWHFDLGGTPRGTTHERGERMRTLASEVNAARAYLQDLQPGARRGFRERSDR